MVKIGFYYAFFILKFYIFYMKHSVLTHCKVFYQKEIAEK